MRYCWVHIITLNWNGKLELMLWILMTCWHECACAKTQNSEKSRLKTSQTCQKQLAVAQIHGPCGIVMVWPRLTPSFKPNSATARVQWACHTLLLVLGTMPCTILGSWRFVKSMGNTNQCKIFGKNDGKNDAIPVDVGIYGDMPWITCRDLEIPATGCC